MIQGGSIGGGGGLGCVERVDKGCCFGLDGMAYGRRACFLEDDLPGEIRIFTLARLSESVRVAHPPAFGLSLDMTGGRR